MGMAEPSSVRLPHSLSKGVLQLRAPLESDESAIRAYATDPEVTRYLGWPTHRGVEDTRKWLQECDRAWQEGTSFPYSIVHAGRVVGGIGIVSAEGGWLRIGYALSKEAWGKGIATQAVALLAAAALAVPAHPGVEALVHPDNGGSIRVLEKCGFTVAGLGPRCGALPNLGGTPDVYTYQLRRP